ncbi:hypothetical protein [Tenacibaculum sp. 190524A02b]|uniref:Uncharacterized protein n=1 Tax=Tenacibaculum vairaonense TaxID=3137860 RepID=A0ABM9PN24_9FLAO
MESIKSEFFGKVQTIDQKEMRSVYGGFAQTKTKGTKTKETAQDKDSAASQENPKIKMNLEDSEVF